MLESEKKQYLCDDRRVPYILIVDDSRSDICLLESILRSHGFFRQSLSDPTEAIEHCRAARPEIVLLDISMPEMNGFQVCVQLKNDPTLSSIPVLFLTAMSDVADKIRGFKAGGSDFLVKPYEPSELIARVSTQISLCRAQHELACRNQDLKEEIRDKEKAHAALLDSEYRNEAVLNNAAVCIGLLSLDGTYEMVNGLYADVFGYSRAEFQNMQLQDIVHPDYVDATEEVMEYIRYGQLEQHYADKKFIRKDGSVFPGGHWLSPRRTGYGSCNGFVCIISDLTEQEKAENELRLAHTVFETSSEGMLVTDAENCIIMVNPAFTAITGYQREQAIGRDPSFLKSERQDEAFYRQMWKILLRKNNWQGEIWNRRRNGEEYPQWLSIAVIRNRNKSIAHYVALFSDISDRKKAEEILRHQAMHDPLTRLPNRVMFDERLRGSLSRAKRLNSQVALLYLDLDNFKTINDSLGHLAGDRVLQMVADRLRDCLRLEDVVARIGGDEFSAILDDIDSIDDALATAERIIASLGAVECSVGGERIQTSIGIAIYPDHGTDTEDLLYHADHAMYTAKRMGKGRSFLAGTTSDDDKSTEK
ncbi:MAG: diguanylate cyclase [Candidatus Electrothrix sp. GM3_4]|nr:diguanylate cyclase [Candidatus Electrothrix sp. GM3_4]